MSGEDDRYAFFLRRCISYLSHKPRSIEEIRQYLHKKKAEKTLISGIIHRLIELGYLDDQKYADVFTVQQHLSHGCGSMMVREKLRTKGIAPDMIEQTLARHVSDEEDSIRTLIEKKLRHIVKPVSFEVKVKLSRFLLRRGFQVSLVRRMVDGISKTQYNTS